MTTTRKQLAAVPVKRQKHCIDGVLLLDKPIGCSSTQALQKAKWLLSAKKAGHTGTLDPFASGLLPLCFGEATKFAQILLDSNKTYLADVCLGIRTTSGDTEGAIVSEQTVQVSQAQIESALQQFLGAQQQTPPMTSALKHQGKALYEYARAGIEIPREARAIVIFRLQLLSCFENGFQMLVSCSKGTYIRVLAQDIGDYLGCGAHLTGLRRTQTANLSLENAVTIEHLENTAESQRAALLLPVDCLLADYPALYLSAEDRFALQQGRDLPSPSTTLGRYRLYDTAGDFFGLGLINAEARLVSQRLLTSHT